MMMAATRAEVSSLWDLSGGVWVEVEMILVSSCVLPLIFITNFFVTTSRPQKN